MKLNVDEMIEKIQILPLNVKEKEEFLLTNITVILDKMALKNSHLNKQDLVEKLITENPIYKDQILKMLSKNVDNQLSN
jgi:hypothetical protein